MSFRFEFFNFCKLVVLCGDDVVNYHKGYTVNPLSEAPMSHFWKSRRISDEVFDRFFFGILDLVEDGLTATKLVGLGNTTKLPKLIVFEVLNEGDFDFPFKISNSNWTTCEIHKVCDVTVS